MLHDGAGGLLQVTDAAIVAQSLPELEEGGLVDIGKSLHGGKGGEEAVEVGLDRLGAGLLEHDLGDEDGVRIAGMSPRKVAAVLAVPVQKEGDGGRGEGHGKLRFK
jgi:hypothetical protein